MNHNPDLLVVEAKTLLKNLFKVPDYITNEESEKIDRLVDCIVSAAILEVADIFESAILSNKEQYIKDCNNKSDLEC